MKEFDSVINLSGGLDSTFATWKFLKENPDKKLLISHCKPIKANQIHYGKKYNIEERYNAERKAFDDVITYLSNNFKNFEVIHSEIKLDTKCNVRTNYQFLIQFCTIMSIYQSDYKVKNWIIPVSKTDLEIPSQGARAEKLMNLKKLFLKNINYSKSIIEYTREQMINEIPLELLNVIYYCQGSNTKEQCGTCSTCVKTVPYINKRRNNEK